VINRNLKFIIGFFAATCPLFAVGQATRPQIFVVCASQANQATIYMSGVLQGPPAAVAGFQTGFAAYLTQHYA
jgi:hypothetical protein